jgi:prepilin peptidase CpaA
LLTLFDLAIFAVIGLAAFFDIEWRRIPNWLILFGLSVALGLSGLRGMNEFYQSLTGIGAGIGILFIPFACRWIGAGDVKFLGVMGAFVGPYLLPRVLWYSILVTGVMAIITVIHKRLSMEFLTRACVDFKQAMLVLLTFGWAQAKSANASTARSRQGVPWGVGIGLGTVVAYYLDPAGRWAGF